MNMLHRLRTGLLIAIGLPAALMAGAATLGADAAPQRLGDDVYLSARNVAMHAAVPGDAVVAGGRVVVAGRVGGDALAAGGSVRIDASVGQDLYAAGGTVRVAGAVGGAARLAGGHVTLAPEADIAGGVTVAAGRVTIDGHLRRYALVSAGRTEVNGRIDGDLRVVGGSLVLGPNAVVQGRLDYRGAEPLRMAPGAQVQGGIAEAAAHTPGGVPLAVRIAWVVGWIVAAAVLLALAPRAARRVTQTLRAKPVVSPLLGLAWLVGLPLVAVLLIVTVVGIPLGVFAIAALMALIPLGGLAAAAGLGDSVVERRGPAKTWQRVLATALALLLLFALARLPYIGWLVWLLAPLFGIGAIALAGFGARRSQPMGGS
jgi:cytoskeletal protein CcmA (bactofilin family)